MRDGTGVLQGVLLKANVSEATWELQQSLTQESVVALTGEVKEDDRAPGGYELGVTAVELLSAADEYPIQKKEHGVEFLLDKRHLWLRSSMQRAGLRVRAEVEQSIHDFLYNNDFVRIDTPILTGAIGEHAGTLFETDYFGQSAYLAQTGQLYVEAACPAFKRVYSFGPTFRAEKSKTRRHLTEFWMVEPEVAFADSDANMELQEQFVSYIVERALERCQEELKVLERDTSLLEHVKPPFPRMSYTAGGRSTPGAWFRHRVGPGSGRGRRGYAHGRARASPLRPRLSEEGKGLLHEGKPRRSRGPSCATTCLAPEGYGEIIGGSQREDDLGLLAEPIREEGLPEAAYDWYLDLRRYGTFPHSGFGLGVERTVAWITGRHHIRELIPFPRMMNRLYP